MRLTTLKPAKEKITKGEISAAHFIPYKCHWNSNTILTYKEELVRVIGIKGFAFETADDIDVDLKKNARNNLLKGMASGNFSLYFHTIRRKEKGFPDGEMSDIFSRRVNEEWASKHSGDNCYVNEHYLTIIRGADTGGVAALQSAAKKLQHRADRESWENYMRDSFDELEEMTERILNGFGNYGAHLLGLVENESGGVTSELLEFLARLVNAGTAQPMTVPLGEISHHLPTNRLYFGSKSVEVHHATGVKYAGMVSIKEYRPSTHAGVFDAFMQVPFELVISQSFSFINRMVAISSMQLQQRRLVQSEDVAVSQIQEIDQALDSAMSGEFAFGMHHFTVLCVEESPKELESALSVAVVELSNVGITGVRERMNLEPAYWAQLPCNQEFMARRSTVNTLNIASFASFHNYPSGKRKRNHWGDAVTVLNTVSGTPYFFSFHVRDVGHTMVIGPTGAGKTVLLTFLCAQAQKFQGRLFFFDKDRGAEIFVRAIRGRYMIPDAARVSGFNPFQLEDTKENRSFLIEFLKALVAEGNSAQLPAHEVERINEAVSGNYKLPKEQRRLRNIAPFMGLSGPGTLANRLAMWHTTGSHAKLFDNENDLIDFSSSRVFGIEMGRILQDKAAIAPVLLYLFHRIQSSLRGEPTMIVLDEAWALIDNPVFAPKIKDWLKVLRKLNTFVVFATQSVEDAAKSSISDTLVQQTATQIFLPNLKATVVYREVFMLSEREFKLVKTTDPSTRFFLVKQDNDGVIARVDLGGMNEVVRVLSARADTVVLLDEIISEVGEDPDDWLPIYYKRSGRK
ncbi:MAG: VirB4 family type IV secretion/conjugal transfer ATPase [Alphaproteobacteria bacterium]|nr:VirB4 family type IV secretion/conjugal transfer ATPase [Alphaproteobacteria bacterium]